MRADARGGGIGGPDGSSGVHTGPENGGTLAGALRLRPYSIQAGIASRSAPASWHSCAARRQT